MGRNKKQPKTGKNPEVILCHRKKQFANIIVCTTSCFDRCESFFNQFDIEIIKNYIETHHDYELKGVIMPIPKNTTPVPPKATQTSTTSKEKLYWVITEENQYVEVTESEIINNPAQYFGKEMFEKPRDQYEVVVTIKKKDIFLSQSKLRCQTHGRRLKSNLM